MIEQVHGLHEVFIGKNGLELWGWRVDISATDVVYRRALLLDREKNTGYEFDAFADYRNDSLNGHVRTHKNAILGRDYDFRRLDNVKASWSVPLAQVKTIEKSNTKDYRDGVSRDSRMALDILFMFSRTGSRYLIAELFLPETILRYQAELQQAITKMRDSVKREASSVFESREYF